MLPALGTALAVYAVASQRPTEDRTMAPDAEALFNGRLSTRYRSSQGIDTEEVRMIRQKSGNGHIPTVAARLADDYQITRNQILGEVFKNSGVHDKKSILQQTLVPNRSMLRAPNAESSWARMFSYIPNLTVEQSGSERLNFNDVRNFRDQFGHSGGAPFNGPREVFPSQAYYGNTWGVGGQFASHLRTGMDRDDGFLAPDVNTTGHRGGNNVTFGGLSGRQ